MRTAASVPKWAPDDAETMADLRHAKTTQSKKDTRIGDGYLDCGAHCRHHLLVWPSLKEKQRSFVTLDGLRGAAAVTIVTRHIEYFQSRFFESYLAVDFFFVLSGFVLSHAYGRRLRRDLSARDFIKIRLIRLYPLYGLSLAISLTILAITTLTETHPKLQHPATAILFSILFLPTPSMQLGAMLFPIGGTAWSLFFEMVANSWWSIAWKRMRNFHLAVFVSLAAATLIAAALFKLSGFGRDPTTGILDAGWQWVSFDAGLIRVGYSFFCGILIHRIWASTDTHMQVRPWLPALALIAMLTIKPTATYQTAYDLFSALLLCPLIVWIGASAQASGRLASAFSVLGAASYGVYILQEPMIDLFRRVTHVIAPAFLKSDALGVSCILLIFGFTIAADAYFDRPIRDWLTRKVR